MSLITLKLQEASVFIIISAKVSVMKLECSWETSAWNWARGKDERHQFFLSFADKVGLWPLMAKATKERHRRLVVYGRLQRPPIQAMAQLANFGREWVISTVHILLNSCVLAGFECAKGAGPLTGTTAGLTGQLLLFMELFTAWGFVSSGSIQHSGRHSCLWLKHILKPQP